MQLRISDLEADQIPFLLQHAQKIVEERHISDDEVAGSRQ